MMKRLGIYALAILALAGCAHVEMPTAAQVQERQIYEAGVEAGTAQALRDTTFPYTIPTPDAYRRGYNQGYLNILEGTAAPTPNQGEK
jgi:hypothetical protein